MLTKFLSLGLFGLASAQTALQSVWSINGNHLDLVGADNTPAVSIYCDGVDSIDLVKRNDLYASFNVRNNQDNPNDVVRYIFKSGGTTVMKLTIVGNYLIDPQMKQPDNKARFEFRSVVGTCIHELRGEDAYHLLADSYTCSDSEGKSIDIAGACNTGSPSSEEVKAGANRKKFTVNKHHAYFDDATGQSVLFANKVCKCENNCAFFDVNDKYFCNANTQVWSSENNLDLDNNCGNQ